MLDTAGGLTKNSALPGGRSLVHRVVLTASRVVLPVKLSLLLKAALLLVVCGLILYVLLAARYAPVHDALHDFRHSLAIVPCH
jgi:cobalt transporter subunit CbtB